MLSKPGPSKAFVVWGVLFQFFGAVIFAFALPASFVRYSGGGAIPWVFVGAVMLLTGLILLLVGISRALGGLDYLVAVAPTTPPGTTAPITESPSTVREEPSLTGESV